MTGHPAPDASSPGHTGIAGIMVFVERYLLSAIYLFMAARILWGDLSHQFGWVKLGGVARPSFPEAATDVLLFVMQLFVGLMLLFSRRPAAQSPTLKEIFVPLAAAFFFLSYDYVYLFPLSWQRNLLPTVWPDRLTDLHPLDAAGLLGGLLGPAISIWGVIALRRSFGIFVSVRDIVLRGPYRYVRHPIYLGYFFTYAGLVLLERSVAIALLATIHLALFVWRAHLEEYRLAEHSSAYREHMRHSGFLFPRLFR